MLKDSEKLIRIGIECESTEEDTYGVSRMVRKLLEQLALRPELAKTHRFYLYFKRRVPDFPFLNSPLFVKVVTTPKRFPISFNLHYHVWMVARAYRDGVRMLYLPAYQLPLLWFRKSLVMLTEDIWREMRNPRVPFRYRISYSIFSNWAAMAATRIMAISSTSAQNLARLFHISPSRIVVNPLGVEPVRELHGLTRTQPYLLYVGQAFERRRLKETLEAFESIASDFPGLQFVIIGPDKYQPPLIRSLTTAINDRLGRDAVVHFERVNDQELALLYRNAQAVAYISSTEAFGLPPLEALAYGAPAIIADTDVSREIFGDDAFYVTQPDHSDSIAQALRAALTGNGKRESIRQHAPAVLSRYTWQTHADRFLKIISDIA